MSAAAHRGSAPALPTRAAALATLADAADHWVEAKGAQLLAIPEDLQKEGAEG